MLKPFCAAVEAGSSEGEGSRVEQGGGSRVQLEGVPRSKPKVTREGYAVVDCTGAHRMTRAV